jgi:hypothetical protein
MVKDLGFTGHDLKVERLRLTASDLGSSRVRLGVESSVRKV